MKMFGYKPDSSFQLLLLVICAIAGLSRGWRGLLDERKIRHGVPIEEKYARNRTTRDAKEEYKNMRIAVFYDESLKLLGREAHGRIVDYLVPVAVKYIEKLLKIKRANGPILIRRDCGYHQDTETIDAKYSYCGTSCNSITKCGDAVVPEQHLMQCHSCVRGVGDRVTCGRTGPKDGRGVNADFILYVTAKSYSCRSGVIAYASHCQTEKKLDRPVAGHMNVCPEYVNTLKSRHSMLPVLKHELLHTLGFNANLFAFFRKKNGKPMTPRNEVNLPKTKDPYRGIFQWSNNTVMPVKRINWWVASGPINRTVYLMVTPNVQREARKHFNCKSLEGAEMESQAHSYSHWEKRVFDNEGMTASKDAKTVISRITLALLEDTGWYQVNYAMADPLLYGKGLGCDFVKKSCGSWINSRRAKKQSIAPFCDREEQKGCTAATNEPGLCSLKKQSYISREYQNYRTLPGVPDDEYFYYGGEYYADFCAIYKRPKSTDKEALSKLSSMKCK